MAEAERLSKDKHIAQTELAERQAALASAQAQLDAARASVAAQQQRLRWHQITAPFDGVVVNKFTEQGEWVSRGSAVLEIAATDQVYLDVQVPQERFTSLSPDTKITIIPDARPELELSGHIAARVPVADSASRSFRLRIISDQANPALLPGASATALFTVQESQEPVLTIPRDALLRNPDGGYSVYVIEPAEGGTIALRVPIKLGRELGTQIEVTQGISASQQVVVRGNETLRHQQPVQIVTSPSSP